VDLGWADLASAIDAGDDVVLAVVSEAAERLGDAAVSLVNLFDIKRLVIGGVASTASWTCSGRR